MIKKQLRVLAEPNYQAFISRLLPGVDHILGVRLPILRKMAKEIAREDWRSYLKHATEDSFEEIMLQGMVIGYVKDASIEEIIHQIRIFLPKINNWSICDSFCSSLKMAKQNKEELWLFINSTLTSSHEFTVRFGIVMMLNYYVDNNYINRVLYNLDRINRKEYYIQMAIAWAISICYINYPRITLAYLQDNQLDTFTHNKAIQKIMELRNVDDATKVSIRSLKRRINE